MNLQQIIVFVIVSAAAVYLFRNFVFAVRSFVATARGEGESSGCGAGCANCGSAKTGLPGKPVVAARRTDIIPLTEIRTLPSRRDS